MLNLILGISLIILGIVSVFLKDYLSLSEYPFTKYILPGILLIIGFIQIFLYVDDYHEKQKEKALKTTSGTLSSIYILNPEEGKYPRLEIGNSGAIFAFATNSKNSVINTMESLFRLNSLKIFLENGLVKISAKFRNSNGNLVAELIKNEWIHKPLESDLIWDRNYSENALEVKDGKGRVILQVRLKKNIIQLQGVFFDEHGNGCAMYETCDPSNPGGLFNLNVTEKDFPVINPIFKYPSIKYLGIFLNN